MDFGNFWIVVGALVAIATFFVGSWTLQKQFPKVRLEWRIESARLVDESSNAKITNIEIIVEGIRVKDPYLNTITIYSNSRADIPSTAFDAGKPIEVSVTAGGALKLDSEDTAGDIQFDGGRGEGFKWAKFAVAPQLIRKKSQGKLVFVSSGPPEVEVHSHLIDISLNQLNSSRIETSRRSVLIMLVSSAILSATAAMFGATVLLAFFR